MGNQRAKVVLIIVKQQEILQLLPVADAADDIPLALSNIGQLSPGHPLVQRIQRDTGIQDPQIATRYTQQTLSAMKEHANENPERMRSLFRRLRLGKEVKDHGAKLGW